MGTSTYTLLIVDDFLADRELYRRALLKDSHFEYRLLEAESVAEGLSLCRSRSIDAVLLDYSLPDADGLEFLATLSAQMHGNSPPVVMMTGQGSETIAVQAMKLGAQDYLVKRDLTPELLQLTMRNAIENHRLKRQLAKCQARFQMSIDNMRECVAIFSAIRDDLGQISDFRYDYLNSAALENNRMTVKDIGRSLCEVFPAVRTSGLLAEYCQLVATGQPLIKEELVYEDVFGGERLTRAYSIHATKLDDGLVVCWRDLTAQRTAERKLQAADLKIIEIWESMTDAYVTVDRDWRIVYANQAATQVICHLTNLAPAEFLGRSHWDLFPSLVGTDVEREFRRALTDRVVVHVEVWFEPTASWFESHLYPAAEGLGIYFRDISDRKQLEAEQIAAEQERDRFFNMSIDLLAIANFDGYFTRLNPAFERVLGFTHAELTTQPFLDFVHLEDRATTVAATQQLGAGEVLVSFENRYRCQDGSYRWLLWSAIPDLEQKLIYASGHDITDRKQAEESLRQSKRKFTAIFEQSFELMGIVSLDGVLLEVNQTALDSIAARREDIAGKLFWETPWWHTEQLQQQLQDAIARAGQGEFMRYEVQFAHPSGVMLTTDFSLKPVFDDAGKVSTIVAEAHDITERKRAERDLRESQERLRTGIEVAGVGLARFDYTTNLVELSPEAAALYGFSPDTSFVTREQLHATFHPDERAELEAIIATVVDPAGTGWFAHDHRVVWPCGEVRCLSVRKQVFFVGVGDSLPLGTASPGENRSGAVARPSYAILAAIDVTDRKQAEQHLRESEQRLRTGVEVAGVGLAKFDYATNLVELSPEAAALYGFAPDTAAITREQFHTTFHPDERAELEAVIAQVLDPQGQGWFAQDHRVVWPSGEVRCLSVRKQVFFDRSGAVARPSYAILAAIDVTDRRENQAALEERNRELDSFVYVVSHDLKAPLRAVANLSEWIEDDLEGQLTADTRSQMNLLRSRINRMAATIDGLLEYARIGRSEDAIEPVAMARLLADVIDSLAPPPTFTIDLPTELPTLSTKRLPLFQVFVNLIGNGIKHHHSEAGTIQISIAERGDWYEFAVSDDGSGIAPEHQERMFKIFQAVNPQNRLDSTGIGLAIVKKIVEAEGGTIRLESQIGKGTTFYFTWPQRVERG